MAQRFTMQNTEGYDQDQIAELNGRFAAALANMGPVDDDVFKSTCDHIAEQIQAAFDADEDA